MDDPPRDTIEAAHKVADELDQRGHSGHASALRTTLAETRSPSMLPGALRDVCQVVLTAIEAIDPVSAMLVEELRLEVDMRLKVEHSSTPAG